MSGPATLPPGVDTRDAVTAAVLLEKRAGEWSRVADRARGKQDDHRALAFSADAAGARRLAEWLRSLAWQP